MSRSTARSNKARQLTLQEQILDAPDAATVLDIVDASLEQFGGVNAVTAVYRISRLLTSRTGRLRRKESEHITSDPRFECLIQTLESKSSELDKLGLENRKRAYQKLRVDADLRAGAALSVRLIERAKDIQGDLMDAASVEDVLLLVEKQGEIFNKVNTSTALHRIARIASTAPYATAGANQQSPDAVLRITRDERFHHLLQLATALSKEMSIVSVSNTLWALARLRCDIHEINALLDDLAGRAAATAHNAQPKHLATVMWALAVLGHEPRSRLLRAVAMRVMDTAGDFRAPDVVNMLWAYARWTRLAPLNSPDGLPGAKDVVKELSCVALANLTDFTPYQCANLAWSLAMLDAELQPRSLASVLDRAASDPNGLDDTALTHTLWAVGVKGTVIDGAGGSFQTLLAEAAKRALDRRVGRTGAAGVLWACGHLRVTPREGEADALLDCLLDDGEEASKGKLVQPQALVHGVWGICHMDGVTLSQKHRDAVFSNVSRLAEAGKMEARYADALRASAMGAGLDPVELEHALTTR